MAPATATTPGLPPSPSRPPLQGDKVTSQEFHLLWSVQEDAELRGEQQYFNDDVTGASWVKVAAAGQRSALHKPFAR